MTNNFNDFIKSYIEENPNCHIRVFDSSNDSSSHNTIAQSISTIFDKINFWKSLQLKLLPEDRIVSLNGIRLIGTDDCRPNRRNVHCTSKALEFYTVPRLNMVNDDGYASPNISMVLGAKAYELRNSVKNDIVVTSIAGFY